MYYSPQRGAWYCIKCKLLIPSPRPAGNHAELHGLTLPCSRKKPVAPKNQLVEEELSEQARKSIEEFEQTIASFSRKEKDQVYNPPPRQYPENWNTIDKPKEREPDLFTKKILLLMKHRQAGATDEEMNQHKIRLGFLKPPDPEEIRRKEESRQRWLNRAACEENPNIREQILSYCIFMESYCWN